MNLHFYKYQGTGNDFIIVDNRQAAGNLLSNETIHQLCHRRFGIGADGLMLINNKAGYDFEMQYFNADGKEGSMCGNGGRSIVKCAQHLGIAKEQFTFLAVDGPHEAHVNPDGNISLKMTDVQPFAQRSDGSFVLNTGSPHYVALKNQLKALDVFTAGRNIRYNEEFKTAGINVNFFEPAGENHYFVRTYERGVEDETYSCGTGVTAVSLCNYYNATGENEIKITTTGGDLNIRFTREADGSYNNIWLTGPAEKVFEGTLQL